MQTRPATPLDLLSSLAGLIALPLLTLYLAIALTYYDGALIFPDFAFFSHLSLPTPRVLGLYLGWFALQGTLAALLPGRKVFGVALADGRALPYTLNGWRAFVVTLGIVGVAVATGVLPPTLLHDQLVPLLVTANLFSFALCAYIFVLGRAQATPEEKLPGLIQSFFLGSALNPRNGDFDWKFFCESRPGMILWVLIDLSMAAAQYQRHGTVSTSMALVCLFQAFYVADYFWLEEAILTTWDIRHEPFGFMLCWGCLVWIPFTFSLQSVYLVDHAFALPLWATAALVAFNFAGYYIFRSSNLQKHRFRSDPTRPIWGRTPDFIATARGTRLLVAGWWGIARHANYLGDLMMGLAWCLTTGFSRFIPYFYITYFVILLVHRERRDYDHCAAKYGADWQEYARRVRWRIVPGVY